MGLKNLIQINIFRACHENVMLFKLTPCPFGLEYMDGESRTQSESLAIEIVGVVDLTADKTT